MIMLSFFFFNDTATTEIYTLSLHDALPICFPRCPAVGHRPTALRRCVHRRGDAGGRLLRPERPDALLETADRKSTRLNSSHANISYAVFCLKKEIRLIVEHSSLTIIVSNVR